MREEAFAGQSQSDAVKHGQDPVTLSPAVTPDSDGHCVHTVWSQSGQTTMILAVTDLLQIFHLSYTDLLTENVVTHSTPAPGTECWF